MVVACTDVAMRLCWLTEPDSKSVLKSTLQFYTVCACMHTHLIMPIVHVAAFSLHDMNV
jgi:hypothetical protein